VNLTVPIFSRLGIKPLLCLPTAAQTVPPNFTDAAALIQELAVQALMAVNLYPHFTLDPYHLLWRLICIPAITSI
jgi:hypothetical protein